jgi:hypothetical protein
MFSCALQSHSLPVSDFVATGVPIVVLVVVVVEVVLVVELVILDISSKRKCRFAN